CALAAGVLRRGDVLLPAAGAGTDQGTLGAARLGWVGAQHPGAAVSRRLSDLRRLSDDLSRAEPPPAAVARRPVRRPLLRSLHLRLADRAVRDLFQRWGGWLVASGPDFR